MVDRNTQAGFSDVDSYESRQSILFPYSPEKYWEKIRLIIREEVAKKVVLTDSFSSTEVSGMTYKPLYKMEEICSIFSVSRQTIYQWIHDGLLKPYKVRSRVYFLREDLDSLIGSKESSTLKISV